MGTPQVEKFYEQNLLTSSDAQEVIRHGRAYFQKGNEPGSADDHRDFVNRFGDRDKMNHGFLKKGGTVFVIRDTTSHKIVAALASEFFNGSPVYLTSFLQSASLKGLQHSFHQASWWSVLHLSEEDKKNSTHEDTLFKAFYERSRGLFSSIRGDVIQLVQFYPVQDFAQNGPRFRARGFQEIGRRPLGVAVMSVPSRPPLVVMGSVVK